MDITIRVSGELHAELVRRAEARGQTLSDYVRKVPEREAEVPLEDCELMKRDVFDRIKSRPPVEPGMPASELIRQERAARSDRFL